MTDSAQSAPEPIERIRRCATLMDCFDQQEPDRPFATVWKSETDYETVTVADFLNRSKGYATLYQDQKLGKGDPVALILPQGIDLMAGFVGALLVGSVPTILAYPNFKIDPAKYRQGLQGVTRNVGARLTILDESFPEDYTTHLSGSEEGRILRLEDDFRPAVDRDFERTASPDDIALIQHSAGTTGLQKGVALSHRVILNQLEPLAESLQITSEDVVVSWLPLYHDMGLVACFLLPMVAGIPVIMQSPVDWVLRPVTFLGLISRFRGTLGWVPNFAFQFMARRVREDDKRDLDLSSMRALTTTSEPIRGHSLTEFEEAFTNCGLREGAIQTSYGMAESTFAVTQSRLGQRPRTIRADKEALHNSGEVIPCAEDHPRAYTLVSCGHSLGTNLVKVVDGEGSGLPEGKVGEIVVKTNYLFSGYVNRPDLTRKVLKDGWYWTGDSGFILQDDVFVIGRRDDMIIVGGRNLYPQDLEEIAFRHPLVRDGRAVAFGLENEDLGTREIVVIAEVNQREDLEHKDRIVTEIRQDILLEIGIAPRFVEVVQPRWLVKSTAGKPARATNRIKFLGMHPELKN